jgi:hypothetical protein
MIDLRNLLVQKQECTQRLAVRRSGDAPFIDQEWVWCRHSCGVNFLDDQ